MKARICVLSLLLFPAIGCLPVGDRDAQKRSPDHASVAPAIGTAPAISGNIPADNAAKLLIQSLDSVPIAFTVEQDLRIDGSGDASHQPLTEITGLRVDKRGRIFAQEGSWRRIQLYDSLGHFVKQVARYGSGPGNFLDMGPFGFFGDSLWVVSPNQNRLTLFGPEAKVLDVTSVLFGSTSHSYRNAEIVARLSDSVILARFVPHITQSYSDSARLPDVLVSATISGRVLDTVFIMALPMHKLVRDMGSSMEVPDPISTSPLVAVSPSLPEFVIVYRREATTSQLDTLSVARFGRESGSRQDLRFSYTPRLTTQRLRDSIAPAPTADDNMNAKQIKGMYHRNTHFPRYLPPISHAIVGRDGTLWFGNQWAAASTKWTIVGVDNRIIGAVELPARFRLLQADLRNVWGSVKDGDDVPSIVRYRLQRMSPVR